MTAALLPIPMRTPDEVARAFGLIGVAAEILGQAAWREAAAAWRHQIEAAVMLDPTLHIQATRGRKGADMALKLRLADAADRFLAAVAEAREQAADIVGTWPRPDEAAS